ncbi:hypothetical protein [Aggregatilinea lenta]|uniref:hypothetical protein n=1 Tax=Aggregatilinea lenta TaxID=913108 RepID=UPI0013C2C435|nr:hypothetical protein [Aggregatilinea lenta]
MSLRMPAVAVLLLVTGLAISGCGGPDENSPEGVVERFFERVDDQDAGAVQAVLCEDFRQNVNFELGPHEEVDFDFDLDYEGEGDEETGGDTAEVLAWGKIERTLRTDEVRQEVRVQRSQDAPWVLKTFRVNGQWRVCGGDAFILGLLDTPAAFREIE